MWVEYDLNLGQHPSKCIALISLRAVVNCCVLYQGGLWDHPSIFATSVNELRIGGPKRNGEYSFLLLCLRRWSKSAQVFLRHVVSDTDFSCEIHFEFNSVWEVKL